MVVARFFGGQPGFLVAARYLQVEAIDVASTIADAPLLAISLEFSLKFSLKKISWTENILFHPARMDINEKYMFV